MKNEIESKATYLFLVELCFRVQCSCSTAVKDLHGARVMVDHSQSLCLQVVASCVWTTPAFLLPSPSELIPHSHWISSACAPVCARACVCVCVCFTLQGSLSSTRPPNSSVTGYITEGALLICVHLSTHTVTAPVVGHPINKALLISMHLSTHTVAVAAPVIGHPINRALLISLHLSTHAVAAPVISHPINGALLISVLCIFQPTLSPPSQRLGYLQ